MATAQTNLVTMHKYFDLLYGMEMDEVVDLFADDIRWLIVPTGTVINGTAELRELARNHWAASPDRTKKLLNVFATNEYACMEYETSGTLQRTATFKTVEVQATGGHFELRACFVFHFRPSGLIDMVREYFDMATIARFAESPRRLTHRRTPEAEHQYCSQDVTGQHAGSVSEESSPEEPDDPAVRRGIGRGLGRRIGVARLRFPLLALQRYICAAGPD